jgi:hypothetical protein
MATYSVLDQAARIVNDRVELIRLLAGDRKMLMDTRSRIICRCPACRYENERTLAWLGGLSGENASVANTPAGTTGEAAPLRKS